MCGELKGVNGEFALFFSFILSEQELNIKYNLVLNLNNIAFSLNVSVKFRYDLNLRAVGSVVRALRSHRRGHWFESSTAHHNGNIITVNQLQLTSV